MGGNVDEWTTEKYWPHYIVVVPPVEGTEDGNTIPSSTKKYNACRGGNFCNMNPSDPSGGASGCRRWDKDEAKENIGFRVSLFL